MGDTDGEKCITASFVFGGERSSRQYEIQVLQYDKQNKDLGGPSGCLQYHLTNSGNVTTFNWNDARDLKVTHLSNQHYDVCVRRNRGNCGICWTPTTKGSTTLPAMPTDAAPNPYPGVINYNDGTRGSFGLSNANTCACWKCNEGTECRIDTDCTADGTTTIWPQCFHCTDVADDTTCERVQNAAGNLMNVAGKRCDQNSVSNQCRTGTGNNNNQVQAGISHGCTDDYIIIPNGNRNRYCGRYLMRDPPMGSANNPEIAQPDRPYEDGTVCTTSVPFKLTVVTDEDEILGTEEGDAAADMAFDNEASANDGNNKFPLGTMGFKLNFFQKTCVPATAANF